MAVITFDFSSTSHCASTWPFASVQAETICARVFLLVSRVPHKAFLSMATTSPAVSLAVDETKARKLFFHLFPVERRKHPVEGIVRRDARW
jgi:hypothetical protein